MNRTTARAVLLLTSRWLRARGTRRSSVILMVTFAVLAAVFVSVSSFILTPEQQADSDFGAYQQSTYDSFPVGSVNPGFFARARSNMDSAVPGSHLLISTPELRPDAFSKLYVQSPVATVAYVEDPTLQTAFPGRYTVDQGTWPRSPFDVLVSRHLFDALPDRTQFTVLSGRAWLHVIGVVTDSYAVHDDVIIAGSGTWESIPAAAAGHAYQPVSAQLQVLFNDGASLASVERVVQQLLPPLPAGQGDRAGNIENNLSTRSAVAHTPAGAFGASQDLVVSYLPLLLVVLLVSASVVGQTRGDHRAKADRLVAVGVRRRIVLTSQALALSAAAAGSIAAGLVLGWIGAIALRLSLLPLAADQPLSPVPGVEPPALAIAAASLLVVTTGALWPARSEAAARGSIISRYRADIPNGLIRRVSVVLLVVAAVRVGDTRAAAYLAVAAVLLAAPDVLRLVVGLLPGRGPRTFVVGRLMQANVGRQAAAVVVVAGCIAIPICVATQLASAKLTESALTYNLVPAHQVWVQRDGEVGDVSGVARVVAKVPDIGEPVVLRSLTPAPEPNGRLRPAALFERILSGGTATMVLTSADQLRKLTGDALPASAESVLNAGGVLDFTGTTGDQQFTVYSADGNPERTTAVLPTLKVSLPRQFTVKFAGAVLLRTAQQLDLPISDPDKFYFPDVPERTIGAAVAAAVDAGYDSEFVQYNVPPPSPDLPTTAYVFLAGLVLGAFAVLLLVIRGQARQLRSYSSRLIAVGVNSRWVLSLLAIQAGATIGVGLVVGAGAGILGVTITSTSYTHLDIPTLPIALACTATVLAAGLATSLAVRTLTATERHELSR